MGEAPSSRIEEGRLVAEIGKAVAKGLVQGKNTNQIAEDLIKLGLEEDEARKWVNRAMPEE